MDGWNERYKQNKSETGLAKQYFGVLVIYVKINERNHTGRINLKKGVELINLSTYLNLFAKAIPFLISIK